MAPRMYACALLACVMWASTNARGQSSDPATVVFVLSGEQVSSQLTDALLAQFTLVDAQLVFETTAIEGVDLAARIRQARELGEAAGAVAVFWIETASEDEWLLHMMDVSARRVLIRPVAAEHQAAAIEVVAVMTRESTQALVSSVPEPERAGEGSHAQSTPTRGAQPAAPRPPEPPGRWHFSLGYSVSNFAPDLYQHAAGLSAFYSLADDRLRIGLATALSPPLGKETRRVRMSLERYPLMLLLGLRLLRSPVRIESMLGVGAEALRSVPRPGTPQAENETITALTDELGLLAAVAARLRLELPVRPTLSFHVAMGADYLVNNFEYIYTDPETQKRVVVLEPSRPRWVGELGITFRP